MTAVNQGYCRTHPEEMSKDCRKSCADYIRSTSKFDYFTVDEDEESFFDLSAKTFTGENLNFERFEGYVTMVVNMAKLCKKDRPDSEGYFATLEELHRIWPYSLELLVFPFEHPKFDYATEDCTDFEEAAKKTGRPIHVMEMIKDINAPFSTLHPVYQYFKSKAEIGDLDVDTATCFLVNPEGNRIEMHQGASLGTIKKHILRTFAVDYEL